MKTLLLLLFLFPLIIAVSCKNDKNPDTDIDEAILPGIQQQSRALSYYEMAFSENAHTVFRDIYFDISLDSIYIAESGDELNLMEKTDNFLQYEYDLHIDTSKGVDYMEVKYHFDDLDRLDIITVNYYIQDSMTTADFYGMLNEKLIVRYGDYYIDSDGYTVWESSYHRKDSSEIIYDIAIKQHLKFQDPGVTIEFMRFGEV